MLRVPPPSKPEPPSPAAQAQETLRRINALRAAGATCGAMRHAAAPALRWNDALEKAARSHSADMAMRRQLSHAGGDGSSLSRRVERAGYDWSTIGENIAAGSADANAALADWMKSPGHCSNILSPEFTEVGVAGAPAAGDRFGAYHTMVLGRARGSR